MNQHLPTTKRHVIKPADVRDFLQDVMPLAPKSEDPVEVIGWSRKRVWTRIRATYANGDVVHVHFDRSGAVSSAKIAVKMTLRLPEGGCS